MSPFKWQVVFNSLSSVGPLWFDTIMFDTWHLIFCALPNLDYELCVKVIGVKFGFNAFVVLIESFCECISRWLIVLSSWNYNKVHQLIWNWFSFRWNMRSWFECTKSEVKTIAFASFFFSLEKSWRIVVNVYLYVHFRLNFCLQLKNNWISKQLYLCWPNN